ncbi:MAG: DUF1894 domain-containing protein [Candidatus Methanoperedens sp.]|nr:DUF1894 domain-containing protein [Candidatus Methanoperedens sp.]
MPCIEDLKFDMHLIRIPQIPAGADGENVILPSIKPCRESFVLKIKEKNEQQALRTAKKKFMTIRDCKLIYSGDRKF